MNVLLISFLIAFAYILFVLVRFRVPKSISETYYLLGKRGWVFQLVLAVIVFTLYPTWVSIASYELVWLVFVACTSLLFVAFAPRTKYQLEGKVHNVCAIICALLAIIWQLIEGDCSFTIFCMFVSSMLSLRYPNKWCWWFEVGIITSLYFTIGQNLISYI